MKDFFVTVGIIASLMIGAALVVTGIAVLMPSHATATQLACDDAWDRMESFNRCVAKPGCFYDAEMWYEGKKAHSFHDAHCTEPSFTLPKQQEEILETFVDSRYAST